jgi:hypothetical protein
MLLFPELAMDLQGRIWVGLQLGSESGLQRGEFLGGPTRNRPDMDIACLAPLLEIPFDGGW